MIAMLVVTQGTSVYTGPLIRLAEIIMPFVIFDFIISLQTLESISQNKFFFWRVSFAPTAGKLNLLILKNLPLSTRAYARYWLGIVKIL